MTRTRLAEIVRRYPALRIAVVGDFCLDRYFDIDPARRETSIETGLTVHNVVATRCQPGAAGTILNNLVALGVGTVWPVGFRGEDAEGWELERALKACRGVDLSAFLATPDRKTFTYTKPLLRHPGRPPEELNRLDQKNWTRTPPRVAAALVAAVATVSDTADAVVVMDQVDLAGTGVVGTAVGRALGELARRRPDLPILADSRRGLGGWPALTFKMNRAELGRLTGARRAPGLAEVRRRAADLARRNRRPVFVSLAEEGIVGAAPDGDVTHVPALPVRGPIDIVGAGDAVTANLAAALAAGAGLGEAMELAMAGASHVVHQLGTTGTASAADLRRLCLP